jgi:hypothetical protein
MQHSASIRVDGLLLGQALQEAAAPRTILELLRASPTSGGIYIASMMTIPRLTLLWLLLQRLDAGSALGGLVLHAWAPRGEQARGAPEQQAEDAERAWQVGGAGGGGGRACCALLRGSRRARHAAGPGAGGG